MNERSPSLNKPGKQVNEVEAQLGFSRGGRGVAMPPKIEQQLRPQRVETCPRTEWLLSRMPKISSRLMKFFLENLSADQPVSRSQSASQNEPKNLTMKLRRNSSELGKSHSNQVNPNNQKVQYQHFSSAKDIFAAIADTSLESGMAKSRSGSKERPGSRTSGSTFPQVSICVLFSSFPN